LDRDANCEPDNNDGDDDDGDDDDDDARITTTGAFEFLEQLIPKPEEAS
jgi:hypothetical protein